MLDKIKAKGNLAKYQLQKCCILKYSFKDGKSGAMVHKIKIPNLKNTEFIKVTIAELKEGHKLFLDGNLRKWMYGSKSAIHDLNYRDYCTCIKLIAKRLGAYEDCIWDLECTYLEMGGNIKLPRSHERFIPSLISYPELTLDRWNEKTVYFQGEKYSLIFYDKVKELKKNKIIKAKLADKINKKLFILRFEIKIKAKSGYRKKELIQNLGSIKNNWNLLINDWLETFKKAKYLDLFSDSMEVKKGTLTKKETNDYLNFLLINKIGADRGLYFFKYFKKNKKSEAIDYIQNLFKIYTNGNKWDFYNHILLEVKHKSETMKKSIN